MTKKEFLRRVTKGKIDVFQKLLDLLSNLKADYCVIGGLAVNVYAEPVVSLDLDMVVVLKATQKLGKLAQKFGFKVEEFAHSLNLNHSQSDIRIQLQTDPRYQAFLKQAKMEDVLGYPMKVAAAEDVLQGKIWAYLDEKRRGSKRQKDLSDILRLIETNPALKKQLPSSLLDKIF